MQAALNPDSRTPKYHGQERLIAAEQVDDAKAWAHRRGLKDIANRPELFPELPGIGFALGSLLGCSVAVVYNIGKKLISFCVDTGFTCFGLVEQNYELPEEVLHEMGIETIPVPRTQIERVDLPRTQVMGTGIEQAEYETIDITVLRRGKSLMRGKIRRESYEG